MKKRYILLALAGALCLALLLRVDQRILEGTRGPSIQSGGLLDRSMLPEVSIEEDDVPLTDLPIEATPEEREAARRAEYVAEVLSLVNEAREEAGLEALTLDDTLCTAAQTRAEECVGTFSHTRPDGRAYRTVLEDLEVTSTYSGENLATGHTTPKMVVDRWMQSEGHRANILNEHYTKIGIGLEKNTGNRYKGYAWAQLFTD